jgi:Pentapeptide repeats (8 copies)
MAVRVLLVVVAFGVLYGCAQERQPVEKQEQAVAAERSTPASDQKSVPDQLSQEATLQAYFDRMSILLLDEGLNGAFEGTKGDREVRALARARTLAALEGLDPAHKGQVMQFLVDASLVQNRPGEDPVVSLIGADLEGVDLTYSAPGDTQPYASAPVPDLSSADLTYADLSGANLSGIVMQDARLVGADLRGTNLNSTVLYDANLSGANLSGVKGKTAEQLDGQAASLKGAIMPDGRKYEEWLKGEGSGAED